MKKFELHWQILIALVAGVLFGIYGTEHVAYVTWMGDLFMRGLMMVIVPLTLTSIVSGVANIGNASNLGRLGAKTFGYYISSSLLAIFTGLFFVNLIAPGRNADLNLIEPVENMVVGDSGTFLQTLLNMVPTNIFKAFMEGDMLAIILFAILFGFFITQVNDKYRHHMTDFFNAAGEVMMKITMFVIQFTAFGVFGIVSGVIAENIENLNQIAGSVGLYMATVLLGLFVHSFISLPLILRFMAKVRPLAHFKIVRNVLLTAFSTSSSSATLALNMEAIERKAGVSNKITSFTLPLGATINMDGTALYELVATMFIAQAYGQDLGVADQLIVAFTALLASVGAAGIPMAGLVMITIVLTAVGLPLEGVGLILAVDRILDMFRTTVNILSDGCGAVLVAKSEGEALNPSYDLHQPPAHEQR